MIYDLSVANAVEDIGLKTVASSVHFAVVWGTQRIAIGGRKTLSLLTLLLITLMVNDEEATLNELKMICGVNHHLTSRNIIPKSKLLVHANEAEGVVEQAKGADAGDMTKEAMSNFGARSKILLHFMKGRISLTPMETIMKILGEMEYLEGLVKLARRRKDEKTGRNQVAIVNSTPIIRRIYMNKNYRGKTMHLPVEINNGMIEGLVDTGASMLVMATNIVRELGIMHLVSGYETYKITSGTITTALGRLDEIHV
jgi:hypothetical protein